MVGGIFISYRRDDAKHAAGRLVDRLSRTFSSDQLFLDIDNIEPGLDFVKVLAEKVQACEVLLAVIGPGWLQSTDERGRRRLDNPKDFVRIEIEAALARDIRVIPVLVDGAHMPGEEDLPLSLQPLANRNAVRIVHERFAADSEGLTKALAKVVAAAKIEGVEGAPATIQANPIVETWDERAALPDEPKPAPSQNQTAATIADQSQAVAPSVSNATMEEELRTYMLDLYAYMAAGGVVAYLASHFAPSFISLLLLIILLVPLALVLYLPFPIRSVSSAQVAFWACSAAMGLSISSLFIALIGRSVTQVFLVTAVAFAGLRLYCRRTRKDISGERAFITLGSIGIMAALLVNDFMAASALEFAISVIGVLVFAGLTSYGTKRIKEIYLADRDKAALANKGAIIGALSLYCVLRRSSLYD